MGTEGAAVGVTPLACQDHHPRSTRRHTTRRAALANLSAQTRSARPSLPRPPGRAVRTIYELTPFTTNTTQASRTRYGVPMPSTASAAVTRFWRQPRSAWGRYKQRFSHRSPCTVKHPWRTQPIQTAEPGRRRRWGSRRTSYTVRRWWNRQRPDHAPGRNHASHKTHAP